MHKRTLIFLFSFLFITSEALACSCRSITLDERYMQADAIFIGKVTDEKLNKEANNLGPRTYTVEVNDVFKGNVGKTVSFESVGYYSSCSVMVSKGEKYLMYANVDAKQKIYFKACQRVQILREDEQVHIKELEEEFAFLKRKKDVSSPSKGSE